MTGLNNNIERAQQRGITAIEEGVVVSTSESDGSLSEHSVKVVTPSSGQIEAEVLVDAGGDFYLPPERSRVTVGYYPDETPAILRSEYKDLDINRLAGGERRIGHAASNTHILLSQDGSATINLDDGTTVTIDNGTLSIDGGTTPVVTDVTTEKNTDGYVTSVSTVTNNSIQL